MEDELLSGTDLKDRIKATLEMWIIHSQLPRLHEVPSEHLPDNVNEHLLQGMVLAPLQGLLAKLSCISSSRLPCIKVCIGS